MGRLRVLSFHSVKGGVGKSTLSTLAALHLAEKEPGTPVFLIDMDLTGTSLADALPLLAPAAGEDDEAAPVDLRASPVGSLDLESSRRRIERRGEEQQHPGPPLSVPFLNDWLLYADPRWDPAADAAIDAIAWRLEAGPENLRVLPSSALPTDLAWILPVIFDEEHAAFLEGRLELLLAALAAEGPEVWVVFDVPPTIPGLSRALLSLALRLAHPTRAPIPLARNDRWIPPAFQEHPPRWLASLVTTPDHQDLRAMARWVAQIEAEDEPVFQVVLNRAEVDPLVNRRALERGLEDLTLGAPLWEECHFIPDSPDLRLFRGAPTDAAPREWLAALLARLP